MQAVRWFAQAKNRLGRLSCGRIDRDHRVNKIQSDKYKTFWILLLLTAGALLVHGYHPYAEDAEIYLPGVEKILHPELFPVGGEFFQSHARLTLFPNLIALSLRVTHLPLETGIFLWQVASIFLLLLACWEMTGLAAFAGIFAVTKVLEGKYARAVLWIAFAACVHPLMWVFPFSFCALLIVMGKFESYKKSIALVGLAVLWPAIPLAPVSSLAYHEVAKLHGYFFIQHWEWYEVLGAVAPIGLFWWFARLAQTRQWGLLNRVCRACAVYGVIYLIISLVVDLPARFEALARLQPLRSLHLLYIVLFVALGGFLGEYVLRDRAWRWLLLFVPLSLGMFSGARMWNGREQRPEIRGHRRLPGFVRTLQRMQCLRSIRSTCTSRARMRLDSAALRREAAWQTESRTTEW